MDAALLYDPARVRVLALRTAAAIQWLDGRTSDDPLAGGVIATLRQISFTLGTTWMPHFTGLLGDTSMTVWDSAGPAVSGATAARGFAGTSRPLAAPDDAEIAELVGLAERASSGDAEAIVALGTALAEHDDDPAFLAALAGALGPEGIAALVLAVGTNPSIRPGVSAPAILDAQRSIVESLMPYQSGVLTDPNFTLAGNLLAALPAGLAPELNPGCVDLGDAAPGGGGYVVGPDGRNYPIVIEDEPPGSGDWQVVCYQSGVERFQAAPSAAEKLAAFWAGSTGLVHAPPPNEALHFVAMSPGTIPYLSETPWTPAPVEPIHSTDVPDPAAGSAASAVAGGLDLIITAGQGMSFVAGLDNQRQRAYQVIFEENAQGLRRARIETFTLAYGEGSEVVIVPENVFVTVEGELMSQDITYPQGSDSTGSNVWSQAFDPDHDAEPQPIPGAVLP